MENIYDKIIQALYELEKSPEDVPSVVILRDDVKEYLQEEGGNVYFEMYNDDGSIQRFDVIVIEHGKD